MNLPIACWNLPANEPAPEFDAMWLSEGTLSAGSASRKPPPLNTHRLKPFRQVTRGVILSILETGHVSMEFLKGQDGAKRVAALFVVTGDGQEIYVEQWRLSHPDCAYDTYDGTAITSTWRNFSYCTLPDKYWKRYAYAYQFVELVKSKTGKVTVYSDRAKCVLMENFPPNFEAKFYSGPKIVMADKEVHIQENNGVSLIFTQDSVSNMVNGFTLDLIHHATQMKNQCELLEASVASVEKSSEPGESLFPVTVGRKPWPSFCSSTSSLSENLESVPSTNSPMHFLHLQSSLTSDLHDHQTLFSPVHDLVNAEDPVKMNSPLRPSYVPDRPPSSLSPGSSDSPYRHISTLESRKLRCQLFTSEDSKQADGSTCSFLPADMHTAQVLVRDSDSLQCKAEGNNEHVEGSQKRQVTDYDASFQIQLTEQTFNNSLTQLDTKTSGLSGHAEGSGKTPTFTPSKLYEPTSGHLHSTAKISTFTPSKLYEPTASELGVVGVCRPSVVAADTSDSKLQCSCELHINQQLSKTGSEVTGRTGCSSAVLSPSTATACSVPTAGFKALRKPSDGSNDLSPVVRQVFVPYTGWATQLASGAVWIHYNDGTQLAVQSCQAWVVYVDQEGHTHRYEEVDRVPEVVKSKLEKLSVVLDYLTARPAVSPYRAIASS